MTLRNARWCHFAVAIFVLAFLFPASSRGAGADESTSAKDFKPGDRVEVSRGRQWLKGTVVRSVVPTNSVRVELDPYTDRELPKRLLVRDFPADRLRHVRRKQPVSRSEAVAPSAAAPSGPQQANTSALTQFLSELEGWVQTLESIHDASSAENAIEALQRHSHAMSGLAGQLRALVRSGQQSADTEGVDERFVKLNVRMIQQQERLGKLPDLSVRFWGVLRMEMARLTVTGAEIAGTAINADVAQSGRDALAMMEQHQPERVVSVITTGSISNRIDEIHADIRAAAGSGAQTAALQTDQALVVLVAPIDDFEAFRSKLAVGQETEFHTASRAIARNIDARVLESGQVHDIGPDWPEMDQPSKSDRFWMQMDHQFMTRREIVEAYGRDRLVFVEVVNASELPRRQGAAGPPSSDQDGLLSGAIFASAPTVEGKFIRARGGRFLLGPVKDFDAFCRALDIGEIIERDDSRRVLRVSADPQKYYAKAGGVTIEVFNAEELTRQSRELWRQGEEKRKALRDQRREELRQTITGPRRGRSEPFGHRADSAHDPMFDHAFSTQEDRDDPWSNLDLLLRHAAATPGAQSEPSYRRSNGNIELTQVLDFNAFCSRLDFAVIVDRDNVARSLKIRADPEQLTGDAVVQRVGPGESLPPWEQQRLGLDAGSPANALRQQSIHGPMSQDFDEASESHDAATEYARLADLLHSEDSLERRGAISALLDVRPADVTSKETRQQIARGFRKIAFNTTSRMEKGKTIRGLVIWGGKYSVPLLIELLNGERTRVPPELFDGLANFKDPRGAEAVCRRLGDFFNHENAVECLRLMGPVAEPALIKAAPSNDPRISLAAVQLLGEVGTEKCLNILRKAEGSPNPQIQAAAKQSIQNIQQTDSNNPFQDGQ